MKSKTNVIERVIQKLIAKNRSKRLDNLVGQWKGKQTKILTADSGKKSVRKVKPLMAHLDVQRDLNFSSDRCKKGLVQFKNNYSLLVLSSLQKQNKDSNELWMIRKLTFNKLIITQQNSKENLYVEHYFVKEFEK